MAECRWEVLGRTRSVKNILPSIRVTPICDRGFWIWDISCQVLDIVSCLDTVASFDWCYIGSSSEGLFVKDLSLMM